MRTDYEGLTVEPDEQPKRNDCACSKPVPDWRAPLLCECGGWIPVKRNLYADHVNKRRATGRTTRMMDEVRESLMCGNSVVVVAADYTQAERLSDQFCRLADMNIWTKQFSPPHVDGVRSARVDFSMGSTHLRFVTAQCEMIDWNSMTYRGTQPDQPFEIFFDHFAIETHFNSVLTEWFRYDQE